MVFNLNQEKQGIIAFPNLQVRNLLLRWCFGQKINYLMVIHHGTATLLVEPSNDTGFTSMTETLLLTLKR